MKFADVHFLAIPGTAMEEDSVHAGFRDMGCNFHRSLLHMTPNVQGMLALK
jgi:hypothetical protein